MDTSLFKRNSKYEWWIEPFGKMKVPGVIFASEELILDMDHKVYEQVTNVACLPGIQKASYAMPDAHWGYGFPIGGVAAFDPKEGGVISAGGVGFDISCGVRTMHTGLRAKEVHQAKQKLVDALYAKVPAGVGSRGHLRLSGSEMDDMLSGGAQWAVKRGYGSKEDLAHIEENGRMEGADPDCVSPQAKKRQRDQMGTLGSGNHYLELQEVVEVYDSNIAEKFDIFEGDVVVSIHCGSRGLGHQIGTEFMKSMAIQAPQHGISLPDKQLACAPIESLLGQEYLGAMRAGMNCAMANRQIIGCLVEEVFSEVLPSAVLQLFYDVSHNTCKMEEHIIDGRPKEVFVHRKGATPAGAGVLGVIPGSMATPAFVVEGLGEPNSLLSASHGAGRVMSRTQAKSTFAWGNVNRELKEKGVELMSAGIDEVPGVYKDIHTVMARQQDLVRPIARFDPKLVKMAPAGERPED